VQPKVKTNESFWAAKAASLEYSHFSPGESHPPIK